MVRLMYTPSNSTINGAHAFGSLFNISTKLIIIIIIIIYFAGRENLNYKTAAFMATVYFSWQQRRDVW